MGTSMELRLSADSEESARRAEDRVLREIDRLSAIFSSYDPKASSADGWPGPDVPVRVSPELFEVLQLCDRWRTASGGAFDPRVEALMRLWSRCAKEGRTPTPAEIAAARAPLIRPAWRLDSAAMTAERLSDAPLTLNAIAKGYIVERACDAAMDKMADPASAACCSTWAATCASAARSIARSASPTRAPTARPPSRSLISRSATRPSPPAATRSAGSGSTADGILTSWTPGPAYSRRAGCQRDGHRRSVRRRRRPRHDLQRAPARGQRPPGTGDPGRRMPDRLGRRPRHPQRRLGPLRAAGARAARASSKNPPGARRRSRPMATRGARRSSCS